MDVGSRVGCDERGWSYAVLKDGGEKFVCWDMVEEELMGSGMGRSWSGVVGLTGVECWIDE